MWNHERLRDAICRQHCVSADRADELIAQHHHLLMTHWMRGALIAQMAAKIPLFPSI